jgi:hypothetical protein
VPESRASPNSRHELTSYVVPPPPHGHLDSSLLMLYPRLSLSSSPRSRVRADVVVEEGLVGHHAPTQHHHLPDASLDTATVGLHELEGENFLRRERERPHVAWRMKKLLPLHFSFLGYTPSLPFLLVTT